MALTQPQLLTVVTDRAELTKADTKRVFDALEAVALQELATLRRSGSAGSCS